MCVRLTGHAEARGRAAGSCEWAGDACAGSRGLKGGGGPGGPVGLSAGYEAQPGACAARRPWRRRRRTLAKGECGRDCVGLGHAPSTRAGSRSGSGRAAPGTRKPPGRSLDRPRRRFARRPEKPRPARSGEDARRRRAQEVSESGPGRTERPLDPRAEGSPHCCVSVSAGRRRGWPGTQSRARRPPSVSFGAAAAPDPVPALVRRGGGDRRSCT